MVWRVKRALAAWVLTLGAVRLLVAQPEHCPRVDENRVRTAIDATIAWAVRTQSTGDGRWIYRYDADRDHDFGIYEPVRHAGLLASLYEADAAGFTAARAPADRAHDYALSQATRDGDQVRLGDEVGASALWLVGLTFATEPDAALARSIGRFLRDAVRPDGSVPERVGASTFSPFYTGEVAWALARLHLRFPGEGWDEPVDRILRYVATERDEREGWFPPIPDHWISHTLAEVVTWRPLTDYEQRYALRIAQLESLQIRYESQRTNSWFSQLTRGHQALGAGLGTLTEALTSLHLANPSDTLRARAECGAGQLIERQVDAREAQRFARPDLVEGTWLHKGVTQIDDQQHALSGLIGMLRIIDG